MKKIRTVKSFLKTCLALADVDRDELRGILTKKVTKEDYSKMGALRADIQNNLGEMTELLEKYKLTK